MGSCCCFEIKDDVSDGQTQNGIISALWSKYKAICNNVQSDATTSTAQVGSSDAASNNAQSNTTTSPPTILLFDSDATTCTSQTQAEGQIKEQEKIKVIDMEHVSKGNKFEACELSSDDEVVCPVCLEEYNPENPPIVLQCSHSYHLSCVYEWMERSATCPVCNKVMIFDEEAA